EEGVLHVARGVVGRRVERVEVVPLCLDPGTGAYLEADAVEDLLDLAANQRERVQRAQAPPSCRQRDVDGTREIFDQRGVVEPGQARGDRALDAPLGAIGGFADGRAVLGRQAAERLH